MYKWIKNFAILLNIINILFINLVTLLANYIVVTTDKLSEKKKLLPGKKKRLHNSCGRGVTRYAWSRITEWILQRSPVTGHLNSVGGWPYQVTRQRRKGSWVYSVKLNDNGFQDLTLFSFSCWGAGKQTNQSSKRVVFLKGQRSKLERFIHYSFIPASSALETTERMKKQVSKAWGELYFYKCSLPIRW